MSGDAVRRAAAQGQGEWLKRLFASGANPCECDDVGCTPLHYATMNGFVEAIIICCINDYPCMLPCGVSAFSLEHSRKPPSDHHGQQNHQRREGSTAEPRAE
jgi:hypothetical protein